MVTIYNIINYRAIKMAMKELFVTLKNFTNTALVSENDYLWILEHFLKREITEGVT